MCESCPNAAPDRSDHGARPGLSETGSVSTVAESDVAFSPLGPFYFGSKRKTTIGYAYLELPKLKFCLSPIKKSGGYSPSDEQLIVRQWTTIISKHRVNFTGNNTCVRMYTDGTRRSIEGDRPVPVSVIFHPVIGDIALTITVEGEEITFIDPTFEEQL